jgi:plastocyanin
MRLRTVALTVAVLAGTVGPVAAVGQASASPAGPRQINATIPVSIVNFAFQPKNVQVHVGDTVMWTNNSTSNHTTSAKGMVWNSGTLAPGATFSFTFNTTGTFLYRCNFHPTTMRGGVRVVP